MRNLTRWLRVKRFRIQTLIEWHASGDISVNDSMMKWHPDALCYSVRVIRCFFWSILFSSACYFGQCSRNGGDVDSRYHSTTIISQSTWAGRIGYHFQRDCSDSNEVLSNSSLWDTEYRAYLRRKLHRNSQRSLVGILD